MENQNKVCGYVTCKNLPVSFLNVHVFDIDLNKLDPNLDLNDRLFNALGDVSKKNDLVVNRIGSVITDFNGYFELVFNDDSRPDLLVVITSPEQYEQEFEKKVLHSTKIRANAGRIETFLIKLTTEQLVNANIPLPSEPVESAEDVLKRLNKVEEARKKIENGIQEIRKQAVNDLKERKKNNGSEEFKQKLLQKLSKIPAQLVNSNNLVKHGESVTEKSVANIKKEIEAKINDNSSESSVQKGIIALSEKDKQKLINDGYLDTNTNWFKEVPSNIVNRIVYQAENRDRDGNVDLIRRDPTMKLCLDETIGSKCLEERSDDEHIPDDEPPAGDNVEVITREGILKYVAKLTIDLSSPENPVIFGIPPEGKRADIDAMEENLGKMLLKSGPAEAPAYYDFQNLQIAFEHVWQEAIDSNILNLADDAYQIIVELGGNPNSEENDSSDPVTALKRERELVMGALKNNKMLNTSIQGFLARYKEPISTPRPGDNVLNYPDDIVHAPKDSDNEEEGGNDWSSITSSDKKPGCSEVNLTPQKKLHDILEELDKRLRTDYSFTIFGANKNERSINFGTLITYRQMWEPVSYQPGELVKTITLAPKETRKFSHKTVVKKKRSEKEVDKHLSSRKDESSETSRAETEILNKALRKTNFNITAEGSFNVGIAGGKSTSAFTTDAETTSQNTKKAFREAVFKASQEYKHERNIEVSTEEVYEDEYTESGEISNPNDELAVTFLFYELQRRYRVSEQIHRLTPVVFVAQEVPNPSEIDEDWIIAHDWILKRVILDDSFLPALNYVSQKVVGDDIAMKHLSQNLSLQHKIVDELRQDFKNVTSLANISYNTLIKAMSERAKAIGKEESDGILKDAMDFFVGDDESLNPEEARIRQEAAREAYERVEQQKKEMNAQLIAETSALNALTKEYSKKLSEHLNRKVEIARLKVHVKDNILYYMQAIWLHEPEDQRYFRLHQTPVPKLEGNLSYNINNEALQTDNAALFTEDELSSHEFEVNAEINTDLEFQALQEVADLDNLLGFKGNYMIFPLKKSNALTDYMMAPYVDSAFELHDPDEAGNFTLEQFSKLMCCLKDKLPEDEFNNKKPQLKEMLKTLLLSPQRNNEELIVPTGALFIEALPAAHPILEDFKLIHRAIDVKKVQAEVREMEIDNLRQAARIVKDELEDPDIEKKIVVVGNGVHTNLDVGNEK